MRESEVPTREDVAKILKRVSKPSKLDGKHEKRNNDRKIKVRTELSHFPIEVLDKIESDLNSYEEWEQEETLGGEV